MSIDAGVEAGSTHLCPWMQDWFRSRFYSPVFTDTGTETGSTHLCPLMQVHGRRWSDDNIASVYRCYCSQPVI